MRGPRQELKDFDTFCPKVLAGIGHLPDTIADRSLPVELKRKKRGDYTARFRKRQVGPEFASLRDELHAWGELAVETLRGAWPEMPDAIIDRAADAWEPLVAIADSAGGEWWPQQARHAAVALTTGPTTGSEQSIRLRMLGDVRVIVRALDNPGRVPTADLLDGMHKLDESPWSDFYGKPLTAERLAKTLHGYDCFSGTHRVDGVLRKAYLRSDLEDAFERYLPLETPSTRNTLNNPHGYAENGPSQPVTNTADVTGSETPQTLMVDPMLRVLRVGAVDMGPDVLRNLLDRLADVLNERHANRQMTMDDAQGVWAQAVLLGAHELELLVAGLEEGDLA